MQTVLTLCRSLLASAKFISWLGPLLGRRSFGYFWLETGWAKLQNLDGFT